MKTTHSFGGDWTDEKLRHLEKYLQAYTIIMNKQPFKYAYIDAFAGTGYREKKKEKDDNQISLFEQNDITKIEKYSEGSANIALKIKPEFDRYIFLERSKKHFTELQKLKNNFPEKENKIDLINTDANSWIVDRCNNYKWNKHRAVMFLDPYGMQVDWTTIKAIAETKAIDLWYLFPLGIGVNRLLKKEIKNIPDSWKKKLNAIFGTDKWQDFFYNEIQDISLFGNDTRVIKDTDFIKMKEFIIKRLKSIFSGVAENSLLLYNSKNNPLYLLCFAAGNPKGSKTAIKIAQEILKG